MRKALRIMALMTAIIVCAFVQMPSDAMAEETDHFLMDVDTLDMSQLNSNEYVYGNLSSSKPGIRIVKR